MTPTMPGSQLRDAVEKAAAMDRTGWSAAARSAEVVDLLETRERLDALIQRRAGAWDRDECWAADDALSAVSWLLHSVPMTKTDAMALVRTARHVVQHEATAKALAAGDVSAAHRKPSSPTSSSAAADTTSANTTATVANTGRRRE